MSYSEYADGQKRIQDATFRDQMSGAIQSVAVDILNNGSESNERKAWARARMKDNNQPSELLNFFGRYCMANPTILADKTPADADVKFVISATVNEAITAFP